MLKYFRDNFYLYSNEGGFPFTEPSNSELKRWLKKKCVWCNGRALSENDIIEFPIRQFILNFKSKRRCTLVWEDSVEEYWNTIK